jgi:hypothetical protein
VAPLLERTNDSPDIEFKLIGEPEKIYKKAQIGIAVTVHNKGTSNANQAKVSVYWATTTNWPFPIRNRIAWYTDGITVGNLAKNFQLINIPARVGTIDGSAKASNFVFNITSQQVQSILKKQKFFAIIATVDHPADPLKQKLVRWENNIAAKKLANIINLLP